jgi:hypothetical protein
MRGHDSRSGLDQKLLEYIGRNAILIGHIDVAER